MRTLARFVRAHWGTLLFIALLFAGTSYVVRTKRPPGSMTVIEAQAMDMSQTGTPVGSVPVATEKVRAKLSVPTVTYTGSVVAYNDTDIVARVEGWVVDMPVYPGDRVQQGQLLVRLDSRERSARLQEAEAGASAARYEREAMQREAEQMRAELEEMQRKRDSARAMVEKAGRELESARQELEMARAEREEMLAEIQAAEANNAYWQAEDARAENLLKAGAISKEERQRTQAEAARARAELDQARVRLNKAEARVKQAQAMLGAAEAQLTQAQREAQAMQAGVQRATSALQAVQARIARAVAMQEQAEAARRAEAIVTDYTRITAPVPGVITERLVSPGTLVMPGTVLLKLRTIDRVRLQANVAESDALGIREGNTVTVTIPADPGFRLDTRVSSIFYSANPQSRTVTIEAVVPNHTGKLLPGQYVVMEIAKGTPRRLISVPLSAVQRDVEGKPFVWVVQQNQAEGKVTYTCVMHPEVKSDHPGKCPKCGMDLVPEKRGGKYIAHKVNVTLGDSNGRRVAVLSGLREGDEVITQGNEYLKEGDPVTPVEWGISGPKRLPEPSGEMPAMPGMEHGGHTPSPPAMNQHQQHTDTPAGEPTGKTVYTCPMHPEVRSDKPGDCPKCGMRLEKVEGGHQH
ncbi:Toluene efflux pump periplasmic linker protein TtgD [bacterium HR16]|nr:Toluene efflux pump periplasmic linker protein TtgD [bacterium HR16]